ncbi:unnamed protein product [Rhizophagus irregularis]|nr:unnamed protein product [Rhizophagus irregularis]CAB5387322.1 unnamed protein product [Rhizophagus irregularis]
MFSENYFIYYQRSIRSINPDYDNSTNVNVRLSIDNDILYRLRFFIGIPTLFFITILFINTCLCHKWIDRDIIIQIYGSEDKQILLRKIKEFLKKLFLKSLRKRSNLDNLSIDEWKFEPKSRLLLLDIVKNNDNSVSADNNVDNGGIDETKNTDNDESDENKNNVIISFNAKYDVMIQTNYPLHNIKKNSLNSALKMNAFISSQILFPTEYWFYYYEITILSNPNNNKTIIAIGLATKHYPTNRLPGCDTHSVGFHSDEGRKFHNEKYTGSKYAKKWGDENDVIGCGYCQKTGQVFFTKNGENLGIAYTGLFYDKWYPTIGSNGFCKLKVNFGQKEFKYKEANGMSVAGVISQELLNKVDESVKINVNPS